MREDLGYVLHRVPFTGGFDHLEKPLNANANQYEFLAYAGLEDGRLRTGRRYQHNPNSCPLKTILTRYADFSPEAVCELPYREQLLEAVARSDSTRVTREMERHALEEYASLLLAMADGEAQAQGGSIGVIILSVPYYLCQKAF